MPCPNCGSTVDDECPGNRFWCGGCLADKAISDAERDLDDYFSGLE